MPLGRPCMSDGWSAAAPSRTQVGPGDVDGGNRAADLPDTSAPTHLGSVRRFINGLSSWLLRWGDGAENEWLLFDRPAGSERDLAILAAVMDATIVQRHPSDAVRVAGRFGFCAGRAHVASRAARPDLDRHGVGRTVRRRSQRARSLAANGRTRPGSLGIGALLVYRPDDSLGPSVEQRLPYHLHCASVNRPISPRCATLWPRPTGPPCSTPRVCCATLASVWCPAPTRKPRSTPWAEPATLRGSL